MAGRFHAPRIVYGPQPARIVAFTVVIAAIASVAAWVGYGYGLHRVGEHVSSAREMSQRVSDELQAAQEANNELRATIVNLERTQQLDATTAEGLREQIRALQDEKRRQVEDLAFYKSIVAPDGENDGFQIQNFRLTGHPDPQRFHYEVVLTQALRRDSYVTGVTRFDVHGSNGEAAVVLPLTEISGGDQSQHYFKFKYFQSVEGVMELPEGFVPIRIDVEAVLSGKKDATITRSFDWPERLMARLPSETS